MSPRSKIAVVAGFAIAAAVVATVRLATSGPPGKLAVAGAVSATQDDEGYVRIDLRLQNEGGSRVDVVTTKGASFRWSGQGAKLESLRILGSINGGETIDAPFETTAQLPPIPSGEACMVQPDIMFVQDLDFVGGRVKSSQLEIPVQVTPQHAR